MINLIACIDSEFGIGKEGRMPWPRLVADMVHFKKLTLYTTVICGRKTFDEIGSLPNRNTIVYRGQYQEILDLAEDEGVWIIGGGEVYMQFLPVADEIHLTRIVGEAYGCDTFFPAFNPIPDYMCENLGFYNESGVIYTI